jgi:hypothetical protein
MKSRNGSGAADLKALLGELDEEIEAEKLASMSSEERSMDELAKEILRLERDMTIPGSSLPDGTRIERLTRFIEEKEF